MRSYHTYMSFLMFIERDFGTSIVYLLKQWMNLNRDLIKLENKLKFLTSCKKQNLLPQHLHYGCCFPQIIFHGYKQRSVFDLKRTILARSILRLEIIDLHKHRNAILQNIFKVNKIITKTLPFRVYNLLQYSINKVRQITLL